MKNLLIAIILFVILSTLVSCLSSENSEISSDMINTAYQMDKVETSSTKESKYLFSVASADGFVISVNMDIRDVLSQLGEPLKYVESPSCAYIGFDKTYTYSGFAITTRPEGENDYINLIILTDDSVTTPEGIFIGDDANNIKAVYGVPVKENDNLISYKDGYTLLNFVLKSGEVISIEYLSLDESDDIIEN